MTDWKYEYEDLVSRYRKLSDKYNDLYEKLRNTESKLNSAEFKLEHELEPRIKREQESYDHYVLDGGSDICFRNGISGNCGKECQFYGEKPECTENE